MYNKITNFLAAILALTLALSAPTWAGEITVYTSLEEDDAKAGAVAWKWRIRRAKRVAACSTTHRSFGSTNLARATRIRFRTSRLCCLAVEPVSKTIARSNLTGFPTIVSGWLWHMG